MAHTISLLVPKFLMRFLPCRNQSHSEASSFSSSQYFHGILLSTFAYGFFAIVHQSNHCDRFGDMHKHEVKYIPPKSLDNSNLSLFHLQTVFFCPKSESSRTNPHKPAMLVHSCKLLALQRLLFS